MRKHVTYKLNKLMASFRPDEVRKCFEELEKIGNELSAAEWHNDNEEASQLLMAFGEDKASKAFFGFELLEDELIKSLQKSMQVDDFLISKHVTPREYVLLLAVECAEKNLANGGINLKKNLKKFYFRGEIGENLSCFLDYLKNEIVKIRLPEQDLSTNISEEYEITEEKSDVSKDSETLKTAIVAETIEVPLESENEELYEDNEEETYAADDAQLNNQTVEVSAETEEIPTEEPKSESSVDEENPKTTDQEAPEQSTESQEPTVTIEFKFLEKAKAEIKKANIRRPIDTQSFFDALLAIAIKYMDNERPRFLKSKSTENVYRSDRSLFELTCFVVYLVDMWICFNQEEMRKGFMRKIYIAYINMLAEVFGLSEKEMLQVVFDRQAYYQELEHEREMTRDETLEALANLMAMGVREGQFLFTAEVYAVPKTERIRVLEPLKLWYMRAATEVLELLEKYFDQ